MTRPTATDSNGDHPVAKPASRRPARLLGDGFRAALPTLCGLLAVVLLYAGFFGIDFLFQVDLRIFGVYDAATERLVMSRYGHLLVWHQAKILGVYVGAGLIVGIAAQILISIWERSGVWPRRRRAHSSATPVDLPPTPWSTLRRMAISVLLGLFAHIFFATHAIAERPALFTETLYDHGGAARKVMLALTHGRGLWLVATLTLGLCVFFALAPLLSVRGRRFLASLLGRRLVFGMGILALAVGIGLYALAGHHEELRPTTGIPSKRPSVLLIAVDSLRADRVGPNARHITPALTALAERSVAFDAAHVTVPRTFPSWVTLLTGRYPHHHGIRTMFPSLAERAAVPPALPTLLRSAGYQSAVISDFCGEVFSRIDLGFDRTLVPSFDARTIVLQRSLTIHKNLLPYVIGSVGAQLFPELGSLAELSDAQRLTDQALTLLADYQRKGSPFFLTVFYSSAHFPYAAPAPYYRRQTDPNYRGPFRYHKPPLSEPQNEADLQQVRALYDSALGAADDGARRLIEGLHRLGIDEKTIIIVLADHGENLYDEPGRGMGHGEHLEGDFSLRVPLLVYDPVHRFPAHHVSGLVRDIDIVPTLLQLLEIEPGSLGRSLDGQSLLPLLQGSADSLGLAAFHETELWFTSTGPGFSDEQRLPYPAVTGTTSIDAHDDIALDERYSDLVTVAKHRALRTDNWKIIYRPTREGPRYSLYDVKNDPLELHDLAAERPVELQAMQAALFARVAEDPKVVIDRGYILPK